MSFLNRPASLSWFTIYNFLGCFGYFYIDEFEIRLCLSLIGFEVKDILLIFLGFSFFYFFFVVVGCCHRMCVRNCVRLLRPPY